MAEYLTVAEVAERYGVTPTTVGRWCQKGYLRGAFREVAGPTAPWRIPAESLEDFEPPKPGRPPGKR